MLGSVCAVPSRRVSRHAGMDVTELLANLGMLASAFVVAGQAGWGHLAKRHTEYNRKNTHPEFEGRHDIAGEELRESNPSEWVSSCRGTFCSRRCR